jgi:hypothetical protein
VRLSNTGTENLVFFNAYAHWMAEHNPYVLPVLTR